MDKFVKRLQSRLTREGVQFQGKTVPMWKVRQFYEVFVADRYNPTEDELNLVAQKLTEHCTAGEAEPETETTSIEPIPTPETFDVPVEDVPCLQPPVEEEAAIANEESFVIAPEEGQEANSSIVPQQPIEIQPVLGGISEAQVTQAISEAIAQVGQQGNAEAVQLLTSLADELSADIKDTQEMVTALVTAYLGKRQLLLSSAVGTLNSLRSAQTESFQAGLDQSFFGSKHQTKREFLSKVGAMFN